MTEILFWICIAALLHSYVFFPWSLEILAKLKAGSDDSTDLSDELYQPRVSVLMSAYNEEVVMADKIKSLFASKYPLDKLEILIGSDASTDGTNRILLAAQKEHPDQLKVKLFPQRQGKPGVINHLATEASGEILLLTDSNVMFDEHTIAQLVKHFKKEEIGLVDGVMINRKTSNRGISIPESYYISREVRIKELEGRLWGSMMGPFGGCFAIRKELYSQIPYNFVVDDFYLVMRVFEQAKKAINERGARAYENVSHSLAEEYRRKVRISAGNFQNLMRFKHLLFKPFSGLSYSFWSHKLIRWMGPFLLLILYFCSWKLRELSPLYLYSLYIQTAFLLLPALDLLLQRLGSNISLFRYLTHFYVMNLALLVGFFKYAKGIRTNVWQPTKRLH